MLSGYLNVERLSHHNYKMNCAMTIKLGRFVSEARKAREGETKHVMIS
jgi:hypothetical protein